MIDYFGGIRDIKDKIIRIIHNLSFIEDPTRIFRAIKFSNRFGFSIGKVTSNLIKNALNIGTIKHLSGASGAFGAQADFWGRKSITGPCGPYRILDWIK